MVGQMRTGRERKMLTDWFDILRKKHGYSPKRSRN
jgi:hypothetical protein